MLRKHLSFYRQFFADEYSNLRLVLGNRKGYADSLGFMEKMKAIVQEVLPDVPIAYNDTGENHGYYQGLNIKIHLRRAESLIEIGDGGFVNWIQQMNNRKKERCLISAISLDRLL